MRVVRPLLVAAVATVSLATAGAPAMADDPVDVAVLTLGSLGGPAAAVGDVLTATVAAGTTADFATAAGGSTGIKCAQSSFTSSVVDNPVAPGVATESTTDQRFASCTANIFGVTRVNSVTVNNTPFQTTVDSTGVVTVSGTPELPIKTTLSLGTILGSVTCVYTATNGSITGSVVNDNNSINFVDQPFTKSAGPITCPGSGFFTASYSPVLDTTAEGSPAVFTN